MNYIYVHINKCAGSSVKKALTGKVDHAHKDIYCIRRSMEATQFRDAFKFAFIRHPIGRVESMYRYRHKTNQHGLRSDNIGFQDWFKMTFIDKKLPYYNNPLMFAPCIDWITDNGKIQVDFVGKVENMQQDFQYVCDRLEIDAQLPRINTTNPFIVTKWTDGMVKAIQHIWKKDFQWY